MRARYQFVLLLPTPWAARWCPAVYDSALEDTPAVRRAMASYLREHPVCAWSGSTVHLNVHHILPAHECVLTGRRDLLTDPANMITLSRGVADDWIGEDNWHWIIGHHRDWSHWNLNVRADCAAHTDEG